MQITLPVSDEIVHEAQFRGYSLQDFVELLIDKGLDAVLDRHVMVSALDRIRALRTEGPDSKS